MVRHANFFPLSHLPDPTTILFLQRCDGAKPSCQQCSRAKKADCCEYDDGKGKTRTQLLRENIARLEQRIRELEDPDHASPPVVLHDPNAFHYSGSSSSSVAGSPGGKHFYNSHHSPFTSGMSFGLRILAMLTSFSRFRQFSSGLLGPASRESCHVKSRSDSV
jgi:hypothetical protein